MYIESPIQLCCIKLASTTFQISVKELCSTRVHCIQNEVMFNHLLFCKLKIN